MIQRRNPNFILACLGATASILGCIAVSLVTTSHEQVATPRFYAAPITASQNQTAYDSGASVVISP